MKPILVFAIYIAGFIIFYQTMNFFKVDEYLLFFINNDNNTNNSKPSSKPQKEGDILTPSDAKKPLKLTKQEIGRHAWALLHSIAAAYPAIPTNEEKKSIEDFINGFGRNFPCKICGKHFVKMIEEHPIKHNSREELVFYFCDLHNLVNKFLGKPYFDCVQAFDIWGGDCGCDA